MNDISITLGKMNHEGVFARIVDQFSGRKFNVLVKIERLGQSGEKTLKFCNRKIRTGSVRGTQMSILLEPGGSIAWDLKVESVVVMFKKNGDIVIDRFFERRSRRKRVLITQNPI